MDTDNTESFVLVKDVSSLLPVVESRLPTSVNVYDMVFMASKIESYRKEVLFYVLNGDLSKDSCWIVGIVYCEDNGQVINFSAPSTFSESVLLKAFSTSKIIDWTQSYNLWALDEGLTDFFIKLSLKVLRNPITVRPANVYAMDPKIGQQLNLVLDKDVELKSLSTESDIRFVERSWHHRKEGSMQCIARAIKNLPSCGLYYQGQLVACAITSLTGFVGYLYTDKAWRGRGFGKLVEMGLIQKLAMENYIPYCTVQVCHVLSNRFHSTKIDGLKLSHVSYFMSYETESFDD